MPPDGGVLAVGQRFDVRVEAENDAADAAAAPRGLVVLINGREVTAQNLLEPGFRGERGAGGTGAARPELAARDRAAPAFRHTTNFLLRRYVVTSAGPLLIEARTADGAAARSRLTVEDWSGAAGRTARARNIIVLLGDGMGVAHRTAARIVSRGLHNGKAAGRLAMDTMDVTGMVMTASLNSAITDSSPGMACVLHRPEAQQQSGRGVSRQHAGPLRQSAHRIHRRAAQTDARRRLQRRHRHHRGPHRFDAGGERRAHVRPQRGGRHCRSVLRRARDQWRRGADGRRGAAFHARERRRRAAGRTPAARGVRRGGLFAGHRCAGRGVGERRRAAAPVARAVLPGALAGRLRQGRRRPLQRRAGASGERRLSGTRRCSRTWRGSRCIPWPHTHRPASI